MGVIHAHQLGNLKPLSERTQEIRLEASFDPVTKPNPRDGITSKMVRDRIFDMIFRELCVHVEIFHCFNSYQIPDDKGGDVEEDTGAHYEVIISELITASAIQQGEDVAE